MDEIDRFIAQARAPWPASPADVVEILGEPDERWGDEDNGLLIWAGPDPRPEPVLDADAVRPEARVFAERLVQALDRVVPAPAEVLARHGAIVLRDGGLGMTLWDVQERLADGFEPEGIAWQLLEQLQSDIAEITATPWPGERDFPEPGTRVRDGRIEWWYGNEDDPVLVLDPVDLPA